MKKIIAYLAVLGIITASLPCTTAYAANADAVVDTFTTARAVAENYLFEGYVTATDSLNLRSQPNTSSTILASIPSGTQISIHSSGTDGWYLTQFNGYTGYVKSEYIRTADLYGTGRYLFGGYVNTDSSDLNMRRQPSVNSEITDSIPYGTFLNLYDCGATDWYGTEFNGKYGYVNAQYIQEFASNEIVYDIVGEWTYQSQGQSLGKISIHPDGSYEYRSTAGNLSTGYVKIMYENFSDGYSVPNYAFCENGTDLWFTCNCNQMELNTLYIGNGGADCLVFNPDYGIVSDIVGDWIYESPYGSLGNIVIRPDCTYTYTGNYGDTVSGSVKMRYEAYSDGTSVPYYTFYYEETKIWAMFNKIQDDYNVLYMGNETIYKLTRSTGSANKYGYCDVSRIPATGTSISALSGVWKENSTGEMLVINNGTDIRNGNFSFTDKNGTKINGYVKLQYSETNGTRKYWYNFYKNDDTLWDGFSVTGQIPLDDLYSARTHFTRQSQSKSLDNVAIDKMNNLSAIIAVMSAGTQFTDANDVISLQNQEYVRITDERFSSISDVQEFIKSTCIGTLKEQLMTDCNEKIIEYYNYLYVKKSGVSFCTFPTANGVTLKKTADASFTATTVDSDKLSGYGRAVFSSDNGNWFVQSYEFGSPESNLKGDANCDKDVNIADAVLILQSISNPDKYSLSEAGRKNADVIGNDGVTANDALQIQMLESGIISEL